MNTLTLLPGKDKQGRAEPFSSIELRRGEILHHRRQHGQRQKPPD